MIPTLHIAWRELRGYFAGPLAYVLLGGWTLLAGYSFGPLVQQVTRFQLVPLLGTFAVLLLFIVPLLTMRLWAEERRDGTAEVLFASPLSEWQIAGGKFLGAWAFCLLMLLLTLHFPLFVMLYGSVDLGPVWGGYLGLVLASAAFCAWGLWCSSLTESQVVAGFLAFAGLIGSWFLSFFIAQTPDSPLAGLLNVCSVFAHLRPLMSGVVDTRDLLFFGSLTGFFLYATVRVLESRKWR